jgi:hypothetical protein
VAQPTSHSPQEQKTRVRIAREKVFWDVIAMLFCTIDLLCIVCTLCIAIGASICIVNVFEFELNERLIKESHQCDQLVNSTRVARWFVFKPKNQIWVNLDGFVMEDVGIFYGHLIHFTAFCYILWIFGKVCGNLV